MSIFNVNVKTKTTQGKRKWMGRNLKDFGSGQGDIYTHPARIIPGAKAVIMSMVDIKKKDFQTWTQGTVQKAYDNSNFTDVTLVTADNKTISAHKLFLCSSSSFFENILTQHSHPNPLIVLSGVRHDVLKSVLDFVYLGQAKVSSSQLDSFMEAARALKINGILENPEDIEDIRDNTESDISENIREDNEGSTKDYIEDDMENTLNMDKSKGDIEEGQLFKQEHDINFGEVDTEYEDSLENMKEQSSKVSEKDSVQKQHIGTDTFLTDIDNTEYHTSTAAEPIETVKFGNELPETLPQPYIQESGNYTPEANLLKREVFEVNLAKSRPYVQRSQAPSLKEKNLTCTLCDYRIHRNDRSSHERKA